MTGIHGVDVSTLTGRHLCICNGENAMSFDNMVIGKCKGHEIEYPASHVNLKRWANYLVANINSCQKHNLDEALAAYVSQYLPLYRAGHPSRADLHPSVLKVLEQVICA